MALLKREVEKVTRLGRIDDQEILGQHMNAEFDRALTGLENGQVDRERRNQDIENLHHTKSEVKPAEEGDDGEEAKEQRVHINHHQLAKQKQKKEMMPT